jgi:hypothetical protein
VGMGISMPVSTRSKIRTGSTRYLPTQGIFGRVITLLPTPYVFTLQFSTVL